MARNLSYSIRGEADYEAALAEIEGYFENEPRPGTPAANYFDFLARIIEDYEKKNWRVEAGQ